MSKTPTESKSSVSAAAAEDNEKSSLGQQTPTTVADLMKACEIDDDVASGYIAQLKGNGYESIKDLLHMSLEDFVHCGVKRGHGQRLMRKLKPGASAPSNKVNEEDARATGKENEKSAEIARSNASTAVANKAKVKVKQHDHTHVAQQVMSQLGHKAKPKASASATSSSGAATLAGVGSQAFNSMGLATRVTQPPSPVGSSQAFSTGSLQASATQSLLRANSGVYKTSQAQIGLYRQLLVDGREVQRTDLLGKGSYAEVYKGQVRGTECAVKLYRRTASKEQIQEGMREIELMASLDHPCTVRLLGWVRWPLQMITELCWGDLKAFYNDEIEGVQYTESQALRMLRVGL